MVAGECFVTYIIIMVNNIYRVSAYIVSISKPTGTTMKERFFRAFMFVAAAGAALFCLPVKSNAQNAWIYSDPRECEFRFQMPDRPAIQETVVETQEGPKKIPLYFFTKEMRGPTADSTIAIKAYCFRDHPIRLMRLQKEDLMEMLGREAKGLDFEHKESYFKEFPEQNYTQANLSGFLHITQESPLIHMSNIYVGKESVLLVSGDVIGAGGPLEELFNQVINSPEKMYDDLLPVSSDNPY